MTDPSTIFSHNLMISPENRPDSFPPSRSSSSSLNPRRPQSIQEAHYFLLLLLYPLSVQKFPRLMDSFLLQSFLPHLLVFFLLHQAFPYLMVFCLNLLSLQSNPLVIQSGRLGLQVTSMILKLSSFHPNTPFATTFHTLTSAHLVSLSSPVYLLLMTPLLTIKPRRTLFGFRPC